jgi:hypothetical protein
MFTNHCTYRLARMFFPLGLEDHGTRLMLALTTTPAAAVAAAVLAAGGGEGDCRQSHGPIRRWCGHRMIAISSGAE